MNITKPICLNSDAFYELLNHVVERITEVHGLDKADRWVPAEECMRILNIRSKTTLWELKTQGKIAFSQMGKIILYDRHSLIDYINSNKREVF